METPFCRRRYLAVSVSKLRVSWSPVVHMLYGSRSLSVKGGWLFRGMDSSCWCKMASPCGKQARWWEWPCCSQLSQSGPELPKATGRQFCPKNLQTTQTTPNSLWYAPATQHFPRTHLWIFIHLASKQSLSAAGEGQHNPPPPSLMPSCLGKRDTQIKDPWFHLEFFLVTPTIKSENVQLRN